MLESDLAAEIERCAYSLLGKMIVQRGRGIFPLAVGKPANAFARLSLVLVGEAAHCGAADRRPGA